MAVMALAFRKPTAIAAALRPASLHCTAPRNDFVQTKSRAGSQSHVVITCFPAARAIAVRRRR